MKKYTALSLRLLGLLPLGGGILLLRAGGKNISIDLFGGLRFEIPLEYVFIIIGSLLIILPLLFVYVLGTAIPGRMGKKLLDFADSLDPEYRQLKEDPSPENLSTLLFNHIHRTKKRFYTFLAGALLIVFVVLPFFYTNAESNSQFRRESNRLVSLVQETRIDFDSGDHVREHLHDAEVVVKSRDTVTRNIYHVLSSIYGHQVNNSLAFDNAIHAVYESRIKPHVKENGLLDLDKFKLKNSSSEAPTAYISYLTLLAIVCNQVGNHGQHVDPYIQGRQLLNLALSHAQPDQSLSSTHNASGVNWAGLLKTYGSFKKKCESTHEATTLQVALSFSGIPSQLTLLRQAKNEYIMAEQQSPTNLAKARSKNNQVDLLLTFLHSIHLDKNLDPQIIRDETDRRFLEQELAMKLPEGTPIHEKIVGILNTYRKNLGEALELSPEPEIFFTRAQLLSVGGKFSEEYKLNDSYWSDKDRVAHDAFDDLKTAASMRLSKELFQESNAKQFFLEWLWKHPKTNPELKRLVAS